MQLLQLFYFKALAENEHLLKTAKQLHISAPALSMTLAKLEDELGIKLFDRVGRNIHLNEHGNFLYAHVARMFEDYHCIEDYFSSLKTEKSKTVKIAVAAMTLWNEPFSLFIKEHPDIIIKHRILNMSLIDDDDYLNQFDLIITDQSDISLPGWHSEIILEDPPVLLIPASHPFVRKNIVSLKDVENEPFIALSEEYSTRRYFDKCFKTAGIKPHIIAETDFLLRNQMIQNGAGIALATTLGAHYIESSFIKMIPLDTDLPPRIQCVFTKKNAPSNKCTQKVAKYIINYYKNYS